MAQMTISKAKVGPLIERYIHGEYEKVDSESEDGAKRVAVLGLDNSHNKDYKVGYASDPMIVVQGGLGYTHSELQDALEHAGIWDLARFTPIQIPWGADWVNGFKSNPDRVNLISLIHDKFEARVDETALLGDDESFTVFYHPQEHEQPVK